MERFLQDDTAEDVRHGRGAVEPRDKEGVGGVHQEGSGVVQPGQEEEQAGTH